MNKSESIKELSIALAKFNGEVSKIAKDKSNPFFKNTYATLDSIIDEVRPVLTANGLSIMQLPSGDGEHAIIKTLLLHTSGEWIESEPLVMKPVKNDPQAIGSCITYARRYSITSFLSLNTGEDDDGNGASHKPQVKPVSTPKPQTSNYTPKAETKPTTATDEQKGLITTAQAKRLFAISGGNSELVRTILTKHGYSSSKDIKTSDYELLSKEIEQAVKAV